MTLLHRILICPLGKLLPAHGPAGQQRSGRHGDTTSARSQSRHRNRGVSERMANLLRIDFISTYRPPTSRGDAPPFEPPLPV